jgi:branched-chain amino acid aminotransferase
MNRIWFDGKLHEGAVALSAQDRGLTLGDGLFETILVLHGVALWRDEHMLRMQSGASHLGIAFPLRDINRAIDVLIEKAMTHHVLRLTLTRGAGGRGLAADSDQSTFIGTLTEFDPDLQFQPMTLLTSRIERNLKSPTSSIKTTSYLDQVMAAREAAQRGFDEALMFNSKGRVACCTIGNIFLVMDDTLVTPSLYEGILNGIMRNVVIRAAKDAGLKVSERLVRLVDLDRTQGMFATNSLRYMRPVVLFDDRPLAVPKLVLDSIKPYLLHRQREQISDMKQE